MWLDFHAIILH